MITIIIMTINDHYIIIRIGIGGDRLDLPVELQSLDNYSATLAHKVDSHGDNYDGDDDVDDDDDDDDDNDADYDDDDDNNDPHRQIVDFMTLPPLFLSIWLERSWIGLRFFR